MQMMALVNLWRTVNAMRFDFDWAGRSALVGFQLSDRFGL